MKVSNCVSWVAVVAFLLGSLAMADGTGQTQGSTAGDGITDANGQLIKPKYSREYYQAAGNMDQAAIQFILSTDPEHLDAASAYQNDWEASTKRICDLLASQLDFTDQDVEKCLMSKTLEHTQELNRLSAEHAAKFGTTAAAVSEQK